MPRPAFGQAAAVRRPARGPLGPGGRPVPPGAAARGPLITIINITIMYSLIVIIIIIIIISSSSSISSFVISFILIIIYFI